MDNITIRTEKPHEYEAIIAVHTLAFGRPDEANLVELLRDSPAFIPELSIVAVLGKAVVGHILFTVATIRKNDGTSLKVLALAPMAVIPTLQQQGIGSLMVEEGLKRAALLPYPGVIVLGHAEYFPMFGFLPAVNWGIRCPYYDVEDENWMALELKPTGLANARGVVVYPKEFDAL
jgi:putative acetyltransferase